MAKSPKSLPEKGIPDPRMLGPFRDWLEKQPSESAVTIAARTALRVLPLIGGKFFPATGLPAFRVTLPAFRATAIARFASKYPNRVPETVGSPAYHAAVIVGAQADDTDFAAHAASDAAFTALGRSSSTPYAVNALVSAANALASTASAFYSAVEHDMQQLHDGALTPDQLARSQLWPFPAPGEITEAWRRLRLQIIAMGPNWSVWTDWYEHVALHEPHEGITEAEDAAFTDIPGELPWDDGAEAVNNEIARRLAELRRPKSTEIPDQSPAPIRVEERDGQIAKASNRDSPLSASERDFKAWREPVVDHIDELTATDFAIGTNHSRVRDRLVALGRLLPGDIAEVKDRQFDIGYQIERFEGLMAAYRSGGDDMPKLHAAQFEDLDRLRVALKMGIDKLERWSEFRKEANQNTVGEADADRDIVSEALDEMAAVMEQQPKYFHPELPASFRFLAESTRDPSGATKTVVYGSVKSAENLLSFLGRKALGIGKKSVEAVETHISQAIAASLVAYLSGAAIRLSGALPLGWEWLKALLEKLGTGG